MRRQTPRSRDRRGWFCRVALVGGLALGLGTACKPGTVKAPAAKSDAPPGETLLDLDDPGAPSAGAPELGEANKPRTRPKAKPVRSRDEALAAAISGNPEGAAKFLAGLVKKQPKDHEARLVLVRVLLKTGEYDRAEAVLQDKKGSPDASELMLERARLRWFRGDATQAQALLERLVKREPKFLPARGELLRVLVETGHGQDQAAKDLMNGLYDAYDGGKATTAEQLMAVAHATLTRGGTGGFKDASIVLQDAEELAPPAKGKWVADRVAMLYGAIFREKYARAEATDTYTRVLERDAWDPDALTGMAYVAVDSLQFAAAARTAEEALLVNPAHPGAHAVLARVALIEGRRDEVRRRLNSHVLKVNPNHSEGLAVLAGLALLEADDAAYRSARDRALAANPHNGRFFALLGDVLGFLHLYAQADEALTEAIKLVPDDPYVQSAFGVNRLRLGKEASGRKALDRAFDRDSFNERTRNMLELYEKRLDPPQGAIRPYTELERGDWTVRLPTEDHEIMLPELVASADRARKALDKHYGVKTRGLRLEFFGDSEDFSIRTVGVPSLGAVAVCFGPVITFVGPYRGTHNMDTVIWHELAHVYAIEKSKGRVPRWFTEGLSEWESAVADPSWARESAELLGAARRAGKLRKLSELELAFIRAENGALMEVAYSTAAYAVRYLGETYGRPKLITMLEGYGRGERTEKLFKDVLGKDLATVEKEFERWFYALLDAKQTGWEPSERDAKGDERDKLLQTAVKQVGTKKLTDASRTLQRLISKGGDGYLPRVMLARVLMEGPNLDAAKKHLERARQFRTEAVDPLVLLAKIERRKRNTAGEKSRLREALRIDSGSLDPAARLVMLAMVTNDRDAEAAALKRARAIAPLHPLVLSARARGLATRGAKSDAKKLLARAMKALNKAQGGPADTLVVAAIASAAAGERDQARILATRARADKTLPAEAKAMLAKIGK